MNRSRQLELIKRVTHERASGALQLALSSRQALVQSQQQMEQLKAYRQEYSEKFLRSAGNGISAGRMSEFRQFLERLDQAIDTQAQVIRENTEQLDNRQAAWRVIQSREKAIGSVVEQRNAEALYADQQREQKAGDEGAQIKGAKGKSQ